MPENTLTRLGGALFDTSRAFAGIEEMGRRREELEARKAEMAQRRAEAAMGMGAKFLSTVTSEQDPKARKLLANKLIPYASKYLGLAMGQKDFELDPEVFATDAGAASFDVLVRFMEGDATVTEEEAQQAALASTKDPQKGLGLYSALKKRVATGGGRDISLFEAKDIAGSGSTALIKPVQTPEGTGLELGAKPEISPGVFFNLLGQIGAAQGTNLVDPQQIVEHTRALFEEGAKQYLGGKMRGGMTPSAPVPSTSSSSSSSSSPTSVPPGPSSSPLGPGGGTTPSALPPTALTPTPAPTPAPLIRFKAQKNLNPTAQKELSGLTTVDRALTSFGDQYMRLAKEQGGGFLNALKALKEGRAVGPGAGPVGNLAAKFPLVAQMFGATPETAGRARLRTTGGFTGFKQIRAESGVQYSDRQLEMFEKFLPKPGDTEDQVRGKITALRSINAIAGVATLRAAKASDEDVRDALNLATTLTKGLKGDFGINPDDIIGLIVDPRSVTPEEADMLMILPPGLALAVGRRLEELEAGGAQRP